MKKPSQMRNLGPVMERLLAEIDVRSDDDLAAMGALEAWRRIAFIHPRALNRIGLYALAGALLDRDWRDLPAEVKADLDHEAARIRAALKLNRPAKSR